MCSRAVVGHVVDRAVRLHHPPAAAATQHVPMSLTIVVLDMKSFSNGKKTSVKTGGAMLIIQPAIYSLVRTQLLLLTLTACSPLHDDSEQGGR
jgi:hypothetical protein